MAKKKDGGLFSRFLKRKDDDGEQEPGIALARPGQQSGKPDPTRPLIGTGTPSGSRPKALGMPAGTTPAAPKTSNALVVGGGEEPDFGEYVDLAVEGGIRLVGELDELKIAIGLDLTASMNDLVEDAKRHIRALILRLIKVMPTAQIMLFGYRDYFDGREMIFVHSILTNNPDTLEDWLGKVTTFGGGDTPEALEFPLKQLLGQGFQLIVLCGDSPSHSQQEVARQLQRFPGFEDVTEDTRSADAVATDHYLAETPVHCLVVGSDEETIKDFARIARAGGGAQGELDGGASFLDQITMAALHRVGGTGAVQDFVIRMGKRLSPGSERFSKALIRRRK